MKKNKKYKRIGKIAGYAIIAPHVIRKQAIKHSTIHMMLAHIQDSAYWEDFSRACGYKILDNGFFELGYSLEKEALLEKGQVSKTNCIVLPDGEYKDMDFFMQKGFDVMLVPSSVDQLAEFLHIAHSHEKFQVKVGLSHIHAHRSIHRPKFQVSNRYKFLGEGINAYTKLFGKEAKQLLFERTLGGYTIHLLGLGSFPQAELYMMSELCKFTCDSNSFIWPWYHKPMHVNTFGRIAGKYKESLNFDFVNTQLDSAAVNDQLGRVVKVLDFIGA